MGSESDGAGTQGQEQQGQQLPPQEGQQQRERQDGPAAEEKVADGGYKAALADRDQKIAELKRQVAEAAESKAAAKKLTAEIEKVRAEAADERVAYELRLAGVRNVKAAKALLGDHEGDIAKLREAEPWLFAKARCRAFRLHVARACGRGDHRRRGLEALARGRRAHG